jgi:hypothetical protein
MNKRFNPPHSNPLKPAGNCGLLLASTFDFPGHVGYIEGVNVSKEGKNVTSRAWRLKE